MEIRQAKKHFLQINRAKLIRTKDTLRAPARQFLDILPLLFHVNHPMLPGFVSKNTVHGISEWSPDKTVLKAARRLAKSFFYKRRAYLTYDIHALYLMGSCGTVAYSDKSDFDVWICHRPDLAAEELEGLRAKAAAIEAWAESERVEVHFHLINPESFRYGDRAQLSQESSGSALHHLLLDEFYLTGLLVAGRFPLWWLVPPEQEHAYEQYTAEILKKRFVRDNEVIDLGGIRAIAAEEFFGASLWQLSKGIDSPYKSALKIALMEVYASEYPDIQLLSGRYKAAVYSGVYHLDKLDPYVMLYKKVEEYLLKREDAERLELIRRCFYAKVNEPLSRPVRGGMSWRRELMLDLVKRWDWSQGHLITLESRPNWKINRLMEERRILIELLTNSYQFLSDFARNRSELNMINQSDLNVLGRKLYAAFERKPGKLEWINWGDATGMSESHLTFVEGKPQHDQDHWMLFREALSLERIDQFQPIKRGRTLTELVVWSFANRLLSRDTALILFTQTTTVTPRDIMAMVDQLRQDLPVKFLAQASFSAYAAAPKLLAAALFVNFGVEPLPKLSLQGKYLISNKTDPLCYGGQKENLVNCVDLILVTGWKEIFAFKYHGLDGLMDCLLEYLRWGQRSDYTAPPQPSVHSYNSGYGSIIARRLTELVRELLACFFDPDACHPLQYVVAAGQGFYIFYLEKNNLSHGFASGTQVLLQQLGASHEQFTQTHLDSYALGDSALPAVFPANKKNVLQIFYSVAGERLLEVYILDERGSLFHQTMPFFQKDFYLQRLNYFFNSLYRRTQCLTHGAQRFGLFSHAEFYRIYKKEGQMKVVWEEPPREVAEAAYFNVQVLADKLNGNPVFTLYCEGMEFSTALLGEAVYDKVARYIHEHDSTKIKYPLYISDLDLSASLLGAENIGKLQTIHFLKYKREVEDKLNTAMLAIGMDRLVG